MRKHSSTNWQNEIALEYNCPFIVTLNFIGKRWKPAILWKIYHGYIRFKDLKNELPKISDKMLSLSLSEMEEDGILEKTIYIEVPSRVEYQVTGFGLSLLKILEQMHLWGNSFIQNLKAS